MIIPEYMSSLERRAAIGLAAIYGLRMLGMFLILPVFVLYAATIPGGDNQLLVGIALGTYGLTQAFLQLPFGMASDRYGRKRVIYVGLIMFAAGSFIAAGAQDIYLLIIGRAIQGMGAISAAVTALLADLTREEHRTKAMAIVGSTIGVMFAISMVAGSWLNSAIGVPGIFILTGCLALVGIWVVHSFVPNAGPFHFHSDAQVQTGRLTDVLKDPQLLRLDLGIFVLHALLMSVFVVVPQALIDKGGLALDAHWKIYLPIMLVSFLVMAPLIILAEKKAKLKLVFVCSIILLLAGEVALAVTDEFFGLMAALLMFFIAFNVLEASLPSLVSKMAPAALKGTALGVYNSTQSLGLFAGAAIGGLLNEHFGAQAVFMFGTLLVSFWLVAAATMQAPLPVRSKMFHIVGVDLEEAKRLSAKLLLLPGILEAAVPPDEQAVYLKVNMKHWDEAGTIKLLEGK